MADIFVIGWIYLPLRASLKGILMYETLATIQVTVSWFQAREVLWGL